MHARPVLLSSKSVASMAPAQSSHAAGQVAKKSLGQTMFTKEQIDCGNKILNQDLNEVSLGTVVLDFLDYLRSLNVPWKLVLVPEQLLVHPARLCCIQVFHFFSKQVC